MREGGLVVEGVAAGYGAVTVLDDVALDVPGGQVTGLIGPNGSGKTTLVRVASRALKPWQGSVRVGGVDPYAVSARRAARLVAVVPQEMQPAFSFSVLEVVLMGRSPHSSPWGGMGRDDWAAARRAMAEANVQHLADRPVEELSGGERQRVVLAQALAQDAPVLLLDEPTTHLDLRHVVDSLALVRRLARLEGRAVLAIFHDMNLASTYCDRVYAMQRGVVVAEGTPGEVITRDLMLDVFGVEVAVVPGLAGGGPAVLVAGPAGAEAVAGASRAHVIGGAGRAAEVMRGLVERGFDVTVGVLHAGDTDAAVAERLNLLRVTVPPFSTVDAAAAAECRELIEGAALLVVCDPPFGPGNAENLRLAVAAARLGTPTLMLDQIPIAERDFTGGEATALWTELRRRAQVAGAVGALLSLAEGRAART